MVEHGPTDERTLPNRQGSSDAVLWTIEHDPVLRTTVEALALLDGTPTWEALRARVEHAVAALPRLRQRVADSSLGLGPGRWVDDDEFELSYHLRRIVVPPPGDLRTVLDLVQLDAETPLDHSRPLWQFTLVEGLPNGRAAFVQKLHHSLVDGVGAMALALELYELDLTKTDVSTNGVIEPAQPVRRIQALWRQPARAARSAVRLLWPAPRPLSPLMRKRGLEWRLDVLEFPMSELRAAAHAAGVSLNDVFVTAISRGLDRYHAGHGVPVPALRALMPVSIRTGDDAIGGNRFVPARFVVPIGVSDPGVHARQIHEVTSTWCEDPALRLADVIATGLSWLPNAATTGLFGSMLKGCDFVATNVPGFPVPVTLAGVAVDREFAFAPPSGAAVNVALLSHTGTACIGVNTVAAAVDDVRGLVDCLKTGFDEVLELARPDARLRSGPVRVAATAAS